MIAHNPRCFRMFQFYMDILLRHCYNDLRIIFDTYRLFAIESTINDKGVHYP